MSNTLNSMNPMRLLGSTLSAAAASTSASKPAVQQEVLTEEEKQARRERLSAAAVERSKTWDRKLGQKKTQPSSSSGSLLGAGSSSDKSNDTASAGNVNISNGPVSSETERAIRKTKELEVKIEQVQKQTYATGVNVIFIVLFSLNFYHSNWDIVPFDHTCRSHLAPGQTMNQVSRPSSNTH